MAGVLSRSEGLPVLRLAAGMASGSCFVQYESGNFACGISGHAHDAAARLCNAAQSLPPAARSSSPGSSSSYVALLLSDGAACCLQTNFCLEPCAGGHLLMSARAGLPTGPATARSASTLNRQTLGPGRHTLLGAAALLAQGAVTPKTPGAAAGRRCAHKSQQRRRMRRKFEALEDLLAGACDVLPPPPEHLLTQAPAASGDGGASRVGDGAAGSGKEAAPAGGKARRPSQRMSVVTDGSGAAGAPNMNPVTPRGGGAGGGVPTLDLAAVAAAQDCHAAGALTPTMIMNSPCWGLTGGASAGHSMQASPSSRHVLDSRQLPGQQMPSTSNSGSCSAARASFVAAGAAAPGACSANTASMNNAATLGSTGSSSRHSLRQQVWQEVAELRARELSMVNGYSSSRRLALQLPVSCTAAQQAQCSSGQSAGAEAASMQHGLCRVVDGSGAARPAGARSALKVTFQSPRNSRAHGASSSGSISSSGGRSCTLPQSLRHTGPLFKQQHQQQQVLQEEASLHSVNSLSMFPDPTAGGVCSSKMAAGAVAGKAAASCTSPALNAARLQEQRQHALAVSACKALGCSAAADDYVAALPAGLPAVNLSAAGLSRLPALHRLTELDCLAASFNNISSLPRLVPVDAAAVSAAVAAAADSDSSSSEEGSGAADGRVACDLPPQPAAFGPAAAAAAAGGGVTAHLEELIALKVPSALPGCLTQLSLAYNHLECLPVELAAALPQLVSLDLSHNRLQELPCTFAALSCLKLLFLGSNQLAALPSNLTRLFLLSTLDVSHNKLQQLPADLQMLQSLARLDVQHNQLARLPQGLSGLTRLERLAISHNQCLQLQEGSLAGLRVLTSLEMAGIGLNNAALKAAVQQEDAPPSIAAAAAAVVGSPGLGSITAAVAPVGAPVSAAVLLPSLRVLDLSHNQLQVLPHWLPSSLCCLLVASNRIRELPGDLLAGLAGSLLQLDLQDNVLHDMPAQLRLLGRLQVLSLQGNPGSDPGLAGTRVGMAWAYKWLATQKSAAASAAQRASAGQGQVQQGLPGIPHQWDIAAERGHGTSRTQDVTGT
ncbi:hypothetical protein COO60DRAFT_1168900 [Scenedesmus sp. NREL 46B-D3]|nr:hypothetical protein COO60DRAFT_1168900 [Scenedesmus sp. NREL 46B-D3]